MSKTSEKTRGHPQKMWVLLFWQKLRYKQLFIVVMKVY
jgi:hypothetical protein